MVITGGNEYPGQVLRAVGVAMSPEEHMDIVHPGGHKYGFRLVEGSVGD